MNSIITVYVLIIQLFSIAVNHFLIFLTKKWLTTKLLNVCPNCTVI